MIRDYASRGRSERSAASGSLARMRINAIVAGSIATRFCSQFRNQSEHLFVRVFSVFDHLAANVGLQSEIRVSWRKRSETFADFRTRY